MIIKYAESSKNGKNKQNRKNHKIQMWGEIPKFQNQNRHENRFFNSNSQFDFINSS